MDNKKEDKLFSVADRQLGYFTSQQAEECGYYKSHFHRYLDSGTWVKELRGIYRLARYPIQDRSELALWILWSRNKQGEPQGVWSHETALDIHELTDMMPAKMHLTVPRGFRRNQEIPKNLHIHRGDLSKGDVEIRQGYSLTTPLRTLLDVAEEGVVTMDQIEQGLHEALKRGLFLRQDIESSKIKHPMGVEKLLRILDDKSI
ncbi:MAG: putative transcriptional regulator of viral defense system [Chlamydiales bacterium]|jgi:predicted transcriptional regulator of viral defense system